MEATKTIHEVDFFDLMQGYRMASPADQDYTVKRFNDVLGFIDENYVSRDHYEKMRSDLEKYADSIDENLSKPILSESEEPYKRGWFNGYAASGEQFMEFIRDLIASEALSDKK